MLEKKIEQRICEYAIKQYGWLVMKFSSPQMRSVPDRIFIRNGHVFFIEFKSNGKKPTNAQRFIHRKIESAGISVIVIDDLAIGKTIIDALSKPATSVPGKSNRVYKRQEKVHASFRYGSRKND